MPKTGVLGDEGATGAAFLGIRELNPEIGEECLSGHPR